MDFKKDLSRAQAAFLALSLAILILPRFLRASEPINQLTTAGTDPSDDVLRIFNGANGTGGRGTGTVIGQMVEAGNPNILDLCIVTADHVASGGIGSLGFRSGRATAAGDNSANNFVFNPIASATSTYFSGANKVDLSFVGAQVDLTKLTGLQQLLLKSLIGQTPTAAPAANAAGTAPAAAFNFTEMGYGRSGTPDPVNFPGYAYVYHPTAADEQYGVERFFSNTVTNYSTFTDATYQYGAMSWFLRNAAGGAIPNEGQGNSGDSGAPLFISTTNQQANNFDGILTNVWGDNMRNLYTNAAGAEGFKIGSKGLASASIKMKSTGSSPRTTLTAAFPSRPPPPSSAPAHLSFSAGAVGKFLTPFAFTHDSRLMPNSPPRAWRGRLQAAFDNMSNEPIRDASAQGKSEIPLWAGKRSGFLNQLCIPANGREQPDVFFKGGEINEDTSLPKGGHAVADCFFRMRRRFADGLPDLFKYGSIFRIRGRDVGIDAGWRR